MKLFFIILFLLPCYSFSQKKFDFEQQLSTLSPRSNVVVIQRRYLPRTARFELSSALGFFLSSEFNINVGVGGSFGFNILEKHGFEVRGFYAAVIDRQAIVDLTRKLNFFGSTDNFADKTEAFMGLVYRWFPLYGKMTLFDRKIIPFEVYLMLGGGASRVICSNRSIKRASSFMFNQCVLSQSLGQNKSVFKKWELTSIVGLGQSYSVTKNTAFRLEVTHQYYGPIEAGHVDVAVSFAFSIFFPESGLR